MFGPVVSRCAIYASLRARQGGLGRAAVPPRTIWPYRCPYGAAPTRRAERMEAANATQGAGIGAAIGMLGLAL